MELINNTTKTLRDDLAVEIRKGSKLSIAASCFSIYAFQELKNLRQKKRKRKKGNSIFPV